MHVNMRLIMEPPKGTPEAEAAKGQPGPNPDQTLEAFQKFGYALEQATRPGTVGLAIGANPISLLAWIGEKYREWSDESPSIETILSIVTLYWLTDTYPSSIYTYRYVSRTAASQLIIRTSERKDIKRTQGKIILRNRWGTRCSSMRLPLRQCIG